jgi:hypothetical protein
MRGSSPRMTVGYFPIQPAKIRASGFLRLRQKIYIFEMGLLRSAGQETEALPHVHMIPRPFR